MFREQTALCHHLTHPGRELCDTSTIPPHSRRFGVSSRPREGAAPSTASGVKVQGGEYHDQPS